jgi:hypothetical protein
MTAKAESPPVNDNEMKVLRRTLWIWPDGASVLGCAFITDERDINGILMIPNRHQALEIGAFLFQVPESFSEPRLFGFLLDLTLTACSSLLVCEIWCHVARNQETGT